MSRIPEPFTILLPYDWTPEQTWAVQVAMPTTRLSSSGRLYLEASDDFR